MLRCSLHQARIGWVAFRSTKSATWSGAAAAQPAEAGDIWLYATPILHASEAAAEPDRRRVLQVDFSAEELPGGLHWLGV